MWRLSFFHLRWDKITPIELVWNLDSDALQIMSKSIRPGIAIRHEKQRIRQEMRNTLISGRQRGQKQVNPPDPDKVQLHSPVQAERWTSADGSQSGKRSEPAGALASNGDIPF